MKPFLGLLRILFSLVALAVIVALLFLFGILSTRRQVQSN